MFRPGLDHPPGRGDDDLDISKAGVPGIVGRASPVPPSMPLVVPIRLCGSGSWLRLRLGGCRAAEDRLRRWPAEAEKEFGEATVNNKFDELWRGVRGVDVRCACAELARIGSGETIAQGGWA